MNHVTLPNAKSLDWGPTPESLPEVDVVAIQATLTEQERRQRHWSPRHGAVVSAFPEIPISSEVLELKISLDELIGLHPQVKK